MEEELLQQMILESLLGPPGAPSAAELLADEERRDIRATQMSDRFLPSQGPALARLLMGVPMSMRLLARENAQRRGGSLEDADRLAATMNPLSEVFSHEDRADELRTLAFLEELGILDSPPLRRAEEDPQAQVEALFLSRLAQQDVTDPSRFTPRTSPGMISRAVEFTPFADIADVINARENPGRAVGTGAAAVLAALTGTTLLRRLSRGRRGLGAGMDIGEEGLEELAERRALRERRSAPRQTEGPTGRRATDRQSQDVFRDAENAVFEDIIRQARTRAAQGASDVDPVTQLLRLLEGGN